ncbi:ubiquitin carboxyl-terminal hydrolase MINDY-3-like [Dysidea avara]|uniref:ubiquitin carboxyl-terminal hydrolase MINDY-3-like n=1 Tax=Dysidea avara TaxID=196820 RepID=UPI00331A7C89
MDGDVLEIIWGKKIKQEVFSRWVQGFQFSCDEPLALVQQSGGPCAVLAPVQAFMIQRHLFDSGTVIEYDSDAWRTCPQDTVFMLLLQSLSDILIHSASSNTIYVAVLKKEQLLTEQSNTARSNQPPKAEVITIDDDDDTDLSSSVINQSTSQGQMDFFPSADVSVVSETSGHVETSGAANTVPSGSSHVTQITLGMLSTALQNVNQSLRIASDKPVSEVTKEPNSQSDKDAIVGLPGEKKPRLESCETVTLQQTTFPQDIHDKLHSNIKIIQCGDHSSIMEVLKNNFSDYQGSFGVILFLYSVVLTKGVANLLEEMQDTTEPLIDEKYGHGSQSLVNLLLTGRAVINVFDMDQEVTGLKLKGISQQPVVGFLTILEALRYCKVGSFLKTPQYPVWVVGSETHLTVTFSTERNLTAVESAEAVAKRAFRKFDKEGDDFIATDSLLELMQSLDMETDPDYINFIKKKLDPDDLGIILLNSFLNEFFPQSEPHFPPKAFIIYHYNGLMQSSNSGKVKFVKGNAAVLEGEDVGMSSDVTLLNCLHTKWPGLVITWENRLDPPIN